MSKLVLPVDGTDHVRGGPDARVTLVEYGDFECPFCGRAHLVVNEALESVGPLTRFVFRNFPLSQIHPHALLAAQAAEAAGAQGRFWAMHDMLFENQDALALPHILRYASVLDLDVERIETELREGVYLPKVNRDFRSGVHSGVNGTPTFFIDGLRVGAVSDPEQLALAIAAVASRDQTAHP